MKPARTEVIEESEVLRSPAPSGQDPLTCNGSTAWPVLCLCHLAWSQHGRKKVISNSAVTLRASGRP
jgi:hypothetical protein